MKNHSNYFRLANHVAKLRLAIGISQRDAAAKGGIDATRLSALERGRVIGPGRDFVERVAKGLGVDGWRYGELQAIAARDRVMREAVRNLPASSHGLVDACLDACHSLAEEDVHQMEVGLRQMVAAKIRLQSFVNQKEEAM